MACILKVITTVIIIIIIQPINKSKFLKTRELERIAWEGIMFSVTGQILTETI